MFDLAILVQYYKLQVLADILLMFGRNFAVLAVCLAKIKRNLLWFPMSLQHLL